MATTEEILKRLAIRLDAIDARQDAMLEKLDVLMRPHTELKNAKAAERAKRYRERKRDARRDENVTRKGNGRDGGHDDSVTAQAAEVLSFLNEKTHRKYKPVKATLQPIVARLKEGFSVDDCRAVVASKCRQWGGDEKMAEYLRPKTLFGAANFANYEGRLGEVS